MNDKKTSSIPNFLAGEPLPPGYFEPPNPYADPPVSKYNIKAMVNYALKAGKKITELTKEEADQFLINPPYSSCENE